MMTTEIEFPLDPIRVHTKIKNMPLKRSCLTLVEVPSQCLQVERANT